ncbi:hypothetical protein K1719_035724 [Acacia pycnantha]|nr:hypothetical protein K1719_035724 [Acacia pycnantha]
MNFMAFEISDKNKSVYECGFSDAIVVDSHHKGEIDHVLSRRGWIDPVPRSVILSSPSPLLQLQPLLNKIREIGVKYDKTNTQKCT